MAQRWGIWGTGAIAGPFARGLAEAPGAELWAVGSRTSTKAQAFAERHRIPKSYGSRAALLADPAVEIVYVASPHSAHEEDTLAALSAGKSVLVEKPLSTSLASAERLFEAAQRQGLFLMEAMWTRFLPIFARIEDELARGTLGSLRLLEADFGFAADPVQEPQLFDPARAGGALLDVGVYPLWLALHFLGVPSGVESALQLSPSGVDQSVAAVLRYPEALAVLSASISAETRQGAVLTGTRGRLELEAPWWKAQAATFYPLEGPTQTWRAPFLGNGYAHEAMAVMEARADGRPESPRLPWQRSREILELVEVLRAKR